MIILYLNFFRKSHGKNSFKKISILFSLEIKTISFVLQGGTARSSLSSPTSPHGSEMDDSSAQGSPSTTPTTPPKIVTNPAPIDTLLVPGSLQVQVINHIN